MNSFFKIIISSLLLLPLIGCIDIDQKINLVKDELTYKADIKIDAKIAVMSGKKSGEFCDFSNTKTDGIVSESKESEEGGNIVCSISAKGKIDNFLKFKLSNEGKESPLIQISKIDSNKFRIESVVDFKSSNTNAAGMEGMMEAMLAGRNATWSVSASKILETNGKLADDGKSVSWKVPLAAAFKSPQNFFVVIERESSWLDSIINFFKKIFESFMGLFTSQPKLTPPAAVIPSKSDQQPVPVQAPKQSSNPIEGKWSGWGGNTCKDPITFNGDKLALEGNDFDPVEITTKTPNEFLVKSKSDPKDQGLVLTNVTADSMKITSLASGDNFVLARCK
jgi:hypothetical protein